MDTSDDTTTALQDNAQQLGLLPGGHLSKADGAISLACHFQTKATAVVTLPVSLSVFSAFTMSVAHTVAGAALLRASLISADVPNPLHCAAR